MKFETTIDIGASADTVWNVLHDVELWPEWTQSVASVERLEDEPLTVGSRTKIKQPRLPVAEWTVTDLQPGSSFTWQARGPGVVTTASHDIEPRSEGGVTVSLVLVQSGALGWLIGTLGDRLIRRYLGMEAAGLKQHSEAAGN